MTYERLAGWREKGGGVVKSMTYESVAEVAEVRFPPFFVPSEGWRKRWRNPIFASWKEVLDQRDPGAFATPLVIRFDPDPLVRE